MKNRILWTLVSLLMLSACSSNTPPKPAPSTQTQNERTLTIDLDKESQVETDLRGKETLLSDAPIYIGDNDEVAFIGDIIQKESPVQVKIGDNDEVAFNGKEIRIDTTELRHGDIIQMIGQSRNVFVEVEVLK